MEILPFLNKFTEKSWFRASLNILNIERNRDNKTPQPLWSRGLRNI